MKKESQKSKFQQEQSAAQKAIDATNEKIIELGGYANELNDALDDMQDVFSKIKNVPKKQKLTIEEALSVRLEWRQQAEKIEKDYKKAFGKSVSGTVAGVGTGVTVATLGPTAAMGVATTFGVASTGTAIADLSGAAATKAALAWLGGGALATGGGGIAAGEAFLALAGPVGWAIASVSFGVTGIMMVKNLKEQKRLEEIFTLISKRDVKTYKLALVELTERITRVKRETEVIKNALAKIASFGLDYKKMTEAQQYELGAYVNLVSASTQLLISPIQSISARYSEEDFEHFVSIMYMEDYPREYIKDKTVIIYLANLLYKIELDDKDKKLIGKTIAHNKDLLNSFNLSKKEFDAEYVNVAYDALKFKFVM